MNLANKLTILRIVLSFFFLVFLFISATGAKIVALVLFMAGIITDYFDGWVARRFSIVTDFGKLMDPLADKILTCSAFISFVLLDPIRVPAWMVALIVAREFAVTALRFSAQSKGKIIPADRKGKLKMAFQTLTIFVGLIAIGWKEITAIFNLPWYTLWSYWINGIMWILMFMAVIQTIVTGVSYFWDNRKIIMEGS